LTGESNERRISPERSNILLHDLYGTEKEHSSVQIRHREKGKKRTKSHDEISKTHIPFDAPIIIFEPSEESETILNGNDDHVL